MPLRCPAPRRALEGEAIMELDVVTYPLPSGELGVAAVEKARRKSARAERLPRLARAPQRLTR